MSKGRYVKKKEKKVLVWLILGLIVILAAAAIMFFSNNSDQTPSGTEAESYIQTEMPFVTDPLNTDTETEGAEQTVEPEETAVEPQTPVETVAEQVVVPQPTVVIVQRADAEYEKWLAAAMVVSVSMEYPDFQLEGVYTASVTALEDKFSSDGVYIIFTSAGTRMAIHAKALEGERTNAGTMDISTETIGYATFDKVDPASVNVASMEQIVLEDLSELIAQSLLVSIYTR